MMEQDLFGDNAIIQQNPLTDRRVGFIGSFKNPSRAELIRKVKAYGAKDSSKEGFTRDTQILVLGSHVKQETLNRLLCYEHDGWKPMKISEAELIEIFNGHHAGFETPHIITGLLPSIQKMIMMMRILEIVARLLWYMERIILFLDWRSMFPIDLIQTWTLSDNSLVISVAMQIRNTLRIQMS